MILNIGDGNYVYKRDVISILNIDTINKDENFLKFLGKIKGKGCFLGLENENTKSYIITSKNGLTKVHCSIISSKTLSQRNNIEIWR